MMRSAEKQSASTPSALVFQLSRSPRVGGSENAVCFTNLGTVN